MSNSISMTDEQLLTSFLARPTSKPTSNVMPPTAQCDIALVGEAPGEQEIEAGYPFVGGSGQLLNGLLVDAGIERGACYVGNVCLHRPPSNVIRSFRWLGPEIQEGLAQLRKDLSTCHPNIVVLLGATALRAAKTNQEWPKKTDWSIGSWRGTLFMCDLRESPFYGMKCISTYHPAAILRSYEDILLARYDLRRARKEAQTSTLLLPTRTIDIEPSLDRIVSNLNEINERGVLIALDIEGYVGDLRCLSIATSPQQVFIIPFRDMAGNSWWSAEDEATIWDHLIRVLNNPNVPKVLQNAMYDQFVLAYDHGVLIRGIVDDTMLKHWEQFNEVEKALDVQTSIYTREPFYKATGKSSDIKTFHRYCCLDSAVTYEINTVLDATMKTWPVPTQEHYRFNVRVMRPMMYMQLRGIRFDAAKRDARIASLKAEADVLQAQLDVSAGHKVNVRSPKQMKEFLYRELQLPVQYKRGGPRGAEPAETADFEALLKLAKKLGDVKGRMLMACIELREKLKRASDLRSIGLDPDGRCLFGYIIPGSKTGRLACRESSAGFGTNGQTIREEDRDLFMADDGCDIAQEDLSGADGWTVAAHCAALGDPTMLEDLLAGLKIPMLIGLGVLHGPEINRLDRPILRERQKEVVKGSPFHHSLKQVQHGSNYGMHPSTVALRVFIESYGKTVISDSDATRYQNAYFQRYPGVLRWHEWMRAQIRKGFLMTAAGARRIISGRKNSDDTLKALLAHEPQMNTTYVTNKAASRCYYDPANLRGRSLIVEPLHQIHDALLNQWRREDREWAINKLKEWFDIELVIAGIKVKIPFEGGWGTTWKDTSNKI